MVQIKTIEAELLPFVLFLLSLFLFLFFFGFGLDIWVASTWGP